MTGRRAVAVLLVVLAAAAPTVALAGAPESTPPVVPLLRGQAAPHDGLLVPEATMLDYLRQEADLEACELRVAARDRVLADPMSFPALAAAAKPPAVRWTWLTAGGVGFVVGVAVTGVALWGAVQLWKVAGP